MVRSLGPPTPWLVQAVVTKTLLKSADKVLRFLLVFILLDSVFFVSANLVFGIDVAEFATLFSGFQQTFEYLISGPAWDQVRADADRRLAFGSCLRRSIVAGA